MAREKKSKSWKITFGKYKGEVLEGIINKDPEYIVWAVKNIQWFDIDNEAETALSEAWEFKFGSKLITNNYDS